MKLFNINFRKNNFKKKFGHDDELATKKILSSNSSFEKIESYNAVRTNIMFSLPKSDTAKKILVTSSVPAEGKTTTSLNMAISFANVGAKVLLIDCDLREPRIHRYTNLTRDNGLSNVLCGFSEVDKVIHKSIKPNLDIITSGEIPPNPTEILSSDEFSNMLSILEKRYDYIFLDSPPIGIVTDAKIISENCTGTILIVRQELTTFEMLDESVDRLNSSGSKILGFIYLCNSQKHFNNYSYKNYRYSSYGKNNETQEK